MQDDNELQASYSTPELRIARAELYEADSILELVRKTEHFWRDTTTPYTLPHAIHAIQNEELYTVTDTHDSLRVVGAFMLTDIEPGLHATINFLINPEFSVIKALLKQKIIDRFIDYAFANYDIKKLKSVVGERQKMANKLLKRYKFYQGMKMWNELRINGRIEDAYYYELHKKFWPKR